MTAFARTGVSLVWVNNFGLLDDDRVHPGTLFEATSRCREPRPAHAHVVLAGSRQLGQRDRTAAEYPAKSDAGRAQSPSYRVQGDSNPVWDQVR